MAFVVGAYQFKKMCRQSGVGGCPLNARNFNFSARVAVGSAKEKLKFGFSGGLFALLFAQTKSKKEPFSLQSKE